MRLLVFFFCWASLSAQSVPEPWKREMQRIARLERAFRYDSVATALSFIRQELREKNEQDSDFALLLWYKQAVAHERLGENVTAMHDLLQIIDTCRSRKRYDVLINSHLAMALLQEKTGELPSCYQHLQAAKDWIIQTRNDSLFPAFYVRLSSYFRQSQELELAIDAAKRVLYWERRYPNPPEAATAHLLLGAMYRETQPDTALQHLQWALNRWKLDNDGHGAAAIMHHLSRFYLKRGLLDRALVYNDSSLWYWQGTEYTDLAAVLYRQRADIFQLTKQLDSTLHYTHLYYQAQERYQESLARHIIAGIEAQYNNEKKKQVIALQSEKLELEKRQRWGLFVVLSLVLFLLIIIFILYIRLKNKNIETVRQAKSLATMNQDLQDALKERELLLAEVHHRVKNNLQIIISLLELQSDKSTEAETKAVLLAMAGRIYSIAGIHELIYKREGMAAVDLRSYVSVLLQHIMASVSGIQSPKLQLDLTDHPFDLSTLVPLGVIINELITNSLKHNPANKLHLRIRIQPQNEGYLLYYADNGRGLPEPLPTKVGFHLLKSLTRQLKGNLRYYNADGAVFELFFKERKA